MDGQYANIQNVARGLAYNYGRGIGSVITPVNGLRYWPGTTGAEPVTGRIWFPATGFRTVATGLLSNVGSYGYYWSDTPYSSAYGYGLGFYAGNVNPSNYSSRAFGFAVRCISE